MTKQTHGGGCLCGAVIYRITGPMRDVVARHCGQCRKTGGHFVAATAARADDLAVTEDGVPRWRRSSEAAERGFRGVRGASLFWRRVGGDEVGVMAGGLDGPTGPTLATHIFVQDAGGYYEVAAGARTLDHGVHGLKPAGG